MDKTLISTYSLIPTQQSRLMYVLMRRVLQGDAHMALLLFELSSNSNQIYKLIRNSSIYSSWISESYK